MITHQALAKILKLNYLTTYSDQECGQIAGLMLKDDFPKNKITTWAQAFNFLDYLQGLRNLASK